MAAIWKRQAPFDGNDNGKDGGDGYGYSGGNDGVYNWWWTPAGMATRYAIVAFLFAAIVLFFVGGYYHAQRRIKKGKAPLSYHRWMVRRQLEQRAPAPRYAYSRDPNAYGMENYPPPPPAYTNAEVPPPTYQPPQGATKAMADQNFGQTNRAGESSSAANISEPAASARQ